MLTVPIICFLVRNLQWQHAENDCHRPFMVRPRRDGWEVGRRSLVASTVPVPAHASMRAEPALPPPRGCRTANLLAPRAEGECSTRLPTPQKPRRAGSPSRAARKLQATTPSGSLKRAAKGLAEAGSVCAHAARAPKQLSCCVDRPRASFGMHTGHSDEHAGDGRRPVQSVRSRVRSRSDFLLRTFGATRV